MMNTMDENKWYIIISIVVIILLFYILLKIQYFYQNKFIEQRIQFSNEKLLRGIVIIEEQLKKEENI